MFDKETDTGLIDELLPILHDVAREVREAIQGRWTTFDESKADADSLGAIETATAAYRQAVSVLRVSVEWQKKGKLNRQHLDAVRDLRDRLHVPLPHLHAALDQWLDTVEAAARLTGRKQSLEAMGGSTMQSMATFAMLHTSPSGGGGKYGP